MRKATISSGSFLIRFQGRGRLGVTGRTVFGRHFSMDLANPDHRAAFLKGTVP